MAHNHEFDCKVCGAHLDSRQDLDDHNRENHPSGAQSSQSGMSSSNRSSSSSQSQNKKY
jgi:hypothetical protein